MADEYREDEFDEEQEERLNKRGIKILLIIVAVLLLVFGSVYTGYQLYSQWAARQESEAYSETVSVVEETSDNKVKNPVNFKKYKKKNSEIYAWLKVPGTKIDYPVVQSEEDDFFYLKHSALDKSWVASGAIYTESLNTTTFKDRVTVIYGHNGYSDTMFTTLHYFEDSDFFKKHSKFYIYTPDSKLTYRIVSAFKFDNRHLLNNFDFQDDTVFTEFISTIQNPTTTNKNVRKKLDKTLTINDNIVVLSTCIKNQSSNRYLVCGVLIKDEETY